MISVRRGAAPGASLGFFTWNNIGIVSGGRKWLKRLLWWRLCKGTDFAIAGNAEGGRLIAEAGYPGRILVQPEIGVDSSRYSPDRERRDAARKRLDLKGPVVGYVGRLTEEKGVQDLIDALAGQKACTLLIVGDGSLRAELEARVEQVGVAAHFLGRQPPESVADLLRAMDCLVLPSRTTPTWKEQFGLVLAEAMGCGVPVIGSDSGAIPEVVGDAGLVFREGDVLALREHLSRLLGCGSLRERLGAAGRLRCEQLFSAEALAGQTAEFLRELRR
jgi:glycosyltransferase involved in cell wall biosynthesis